jgi:hypothetical protein
LQRDPRRAGAPPRGRDLQRQPLKERRLEVTFSDDVTAVLEMDQVLKHGYEVHGIMRRSRHKAR